MFLDLLFRAGITQTEDLEGVVDHPAWSSRGCRDAIAQVEEERPCREKRDDAFGESSAVGRRLALRDVTAARPAVGALAERLDGLCDVALAYVVIVRLDTRQRMWGNPGPRDGREVTGRLQRCSEALDPLAGSAGVCGYRACSDSPFWAGRKTIHVAGMSATARKVTPKYPASEPDSSYAIPGMAGASERELRRVGLAGRRVSRPS